MATFTARQSNDQGKKIVIAEHAVPTFTGGDKVALRVSVHYVGRWVPQGGGQALLIDSRGKRLGIYGPNHLFADTADEARELVDACVRRRCC